MIATITRTNVVSQRPARLIFLLIVMLLTIMLSAVIVREWAIDSCLDSGGQWINATKECQH